MLLIAMFLFGGLVGLVIHFVRKYAGAGELLSFVCFIILIILLILLPVLRYNSKIEIAKFNEARRTLNAARVNEDISPIELAAIQRKVMEQNLWLAEQKIWKTNIFVRVYVHPGVMELEPIR